MDDRVLYRDKLIMVMGMQRSGTTALLYALGQDPSVQVENEEPGGPLYDQYRLRSAKTIHPELMRIKRRVLLKPVVEAEYREIDDVIREFIVYDPLIAWIYRDPIDVWSSAKNTFHLPTGDMTSWLKAWVKGNESALRSLSGPFRDRIRAVGYHDLIQHREVFDALCEFLRLEPRNNLFWREDPKKGRHSLPEEIQKLIEHKTTAVMQQLHAQRIKPFHTPSSSEADTSAAQPLARASWTLRTNNDAVAEMTSIAEPLSGTRIAISNAEAQSPWDIQAVWPTMSVDAYRRYTASCWIRSDQPRTAELVLAQDHEPWEGLGFHQKIQTTSDWQHVGVDFWSHADEPDASLRFDLGGDAIAVEISDVMVGSPLFVLHRLSCQEGAKARVTRLPEDNSAVRIVTDELPTLEPIAIQLTAGHLPLRAGQDYTLAVSLRSAEPREVRVLVGQASPPWGLLGLCEVIQVSTDWSMHIFDFKATGGGESRLYFDMGQDQSTVDIRYASVFLAKSRMHHSFAIPGVQCELKFPVDHPTSVRVIATPDQSPTDQGAQVFNPDLKIMKYMRYSVSFVARADVPREIGFGVGRNSEPWTDLGIYHKVGVGRSWQPYYYEFIGNEDCDNARILFDVGRSNVPVEFAEIMIHPMNREAFVSSSDSRTTFNTQVANVPSSIK